MKVKKKKTNTRREDGGDNNNDNTFNSISNISGVDNNENHENLEKRFCVNCRRCNMDMNGSICEGISVEMRSNIRISNATALIRFPELSPLVSTYMLCEECDDLIRHKMMCYQGSMKLVPWKVAWPSFLWHSFVLESNLDRANDIWKLLPLRWKLSWLESVQTIGGSFSGLDTDVGGIIFHDLSSELEWFKNNMDSNKRVNLEKCLNKYCVPTVRCPWGCTEFIEKCGYLSFGLFLYYLNPIDFVVQESHFSFDCGSGGITRKNSLNGLRPDYLSFQDCALENSEWKIQPSIIITRNKGPVVCTCSAHRNGSPNYYIHPPSNPLTGNQTSSQTNNLAPAVLIPRTFKNMKINNYNDSYSMVKLDSGYDGMDCCSISTNRRFDKGNVLSLENEILSVHGRVDIKAKLSTLVRNREISKHYEDVILNEIEKRDLKNDTRFEKENIGSNCIKIKDAHELCQVIKEEEDQVSNGCIFPWAGRIIKCYNQSNDYEQGPVFIDGFMRKAQKEYRLVWLLLSLLTRVEDIWKSCNKECLDFHQGNTGRELWLGWLLKYASNNIMDHMHIYRKKNSLYSKHMNLDKLQWLIHHPEEPYENIPDLTNLKKYVENDVPEFRWRKLDEIFRNVKNIETFEWREVADRNSAFIVNEDTTVIIVHFTRIDNESNLEVVEHAHTVLRFKGYAHVNGNDLRNDHYGQPAEYEEIEFELSYAAQVGTDNGEYNIRSYSDFRETENGGFKVWGSSMTEKSKKLEKGIRSTGELEGTFTVRNCPFLVYTKKNMNSEKINREYLDSLGNEAKCRCPVHDKYLINIPKQNRRFCKFKENGKKGKKCKREAEYRCFGYDNCNYVCCEIHRNESCTVHKEYKKYEELSNIKTSQKYCKFEEDGKKCGKEAFYRCAGYEECNHFSCEKHATEECRMHLQHTLYEDVPQRDFCNFQEEGKDCGILPSYKCPILNCNFCVCKIHKDSEYNNSEDSAESFSCSTERGRK